MAAASDISLSTAICILRWPAKARRYPVPRLLIMHRFGISCFKQVLRQYRHGPYDCVSYPDAEEKADGSGELTRGG